MENLKALGMIGMLILIVYVFNYLNIAIILSGSVPVPVYWDYLGNKLSYNCGVECFNEIMLCYDGNGAKYYKISGGYVASWWHETYFTQSGFYSCTIEVSVDSCRGGCPDKYKECPIVTSCEIIMRE